MAAKQKLRARLRARRSDHVASQPESIRALLFLRPPAPMLSMLREGATIGLYHATQAEAPTLAWARWLHANGRRLALPWFAGRDAPMQFRIWADPFGRRLLEPAPWGSVQPLADAEAVVPDVLVVPLLGFTAECQRIGQGGGHYDRWLQGHPGVGTIGLAWDCQLVESLPTEPHDRSLDAVVTPTRFYRRPA